ncbi:MAG: hypothetical protein R3A52_17815 [Polyangiales bacterium]
MNTHPDHEDILASLDADGDAATRAHVEGCAECSTVADRLRAGRGLIDLARAHEPTLDWSRMEARLEAEAEKVAAEIRAGAVRPPSRLRSAVAAGVMVSMAAAAVLYVGRGRRAPRAPARGRSGQHPRSGADPGASRAARVEARVLLAAGGATVSTADSSTARLSAVSTLVEGVTLAAGDHGRAVVSLRPGWSLDVRPGATANLRRLREDETVVALSGGEARVEPASSVGEDPGVRVRSGRWTVHRPARPVRDEVSTLRVVVLMSRATFEAEGAEPMHVTGPVIFDLPATGAPRAVQGGGQRPRGHRLSALNALGDLAVLPPVSLNATVSFTDGGARALAALEAVQVMGPTTIQAREGGRLSRLEIGTGRVLRWTPVGATVAAAAPRPRVTAPTPAAPDPVQTEEEQRLRAWTGSAVRRIATCFTRCRETSRCPDASGFIRARGEPQPRARDRGRDGPYLRQRSRVRRGSGPVDPATGRERGPHGPHPHPLAQR